MAGHWTNYDDDRTGAGELKDFIQDQLVIINTGKNVLHHTLGQVTVIYLVVSILGKNFNFGLQRAHFIMCYYVLYYFYLKKMCLPKREKMCGI